MDIRVGIELLHQMVSQLLSLGCNTKLVYLADITDPPETPVYKKYHLQFTNDIHDNNHNIFIVPETLTEILSKVCRMPRILFLELLFVRTGAICLLLVGRI